MKSRILAFAGSKQSGKSTATNFLHGYQLRSHLVIDDFGITDEGKLVIDTNMIGADGEESKGQGFLDIHRSDLEFAEWAAYSMWPYIKCYSFAAPLKQICTGLFELGEDQVYGTDTQKNTKTMFRWEEMPGIVTDKTILNKKDIKPLIESGALKYHKSGKMSAREFLQFFGTEICRHIYEDVWHSRLIKDIEAEQPLVAVIDDCRFPNEAEAIQSAGGKVIRLMRNNIKDAHASERALDAYDKFDATIDNRKLSIAETNMEIIKTLTEWGWLGAEIKPEAPADKQQPAIVGGIHKFREESA
jgi:hypothetical protein|tara:strand:- start:6224 stop:7126 length:903 start_codon:yes stop_codon:yes gene_type:complete